MDVISAYFSQGYIGNIIAIDWREIATAPWYDSAASGTKTVGYKTGKTVDILAAI